jgi:hypothetical protein
MNLATLKQHLELAASADVQSAVASTPRAPAASPSRGRRAARRSTGRRTQPEGSTNRARPYREDSETVQLLRNDRGQGSRPAASASRVRGQGRCPKVGHYCGGRTDKHLPRVGNRMDIPAGQRDGVGTGCYASGAKETPKAATAYGTIGSATPSTLVADPEFAARRIVSIRERPKPPFPFLSVRLSAISETPLTATVASRVWWSPWQRPSLRDPMTIRPRKR